MGRWTFLKSVATTGALLTIAGYMGGGSGPQPTADTEAGNGTGNSATGETTTKAEPAEVPSPELTFRTSSDVLRVVHISGERIIDEGADEIYVTVDDECIATWTTDGDKGGKFPIPAGNFLEIESVKDGSTVEVVWVGDEDAEEVLATREVSTGETATTTTTNEAATNKTTTNEAATSETTTTTATETTASSGDKTSS